VSPNSGPGGAGRSARDRLVLFLAQGCGAGRIPVAPGTFGSLVGVGWSLVLLASGSPWLCLAGLLAGVALSVWLCGQAERLLGETDPPSVVLDEIVAIPVCLASWVIAEGLRLGAMPGVGRLLAGGGWLWLAGSFAAFRCFDIAKPWPVGRSQRLPGGWGITVDDLLAAVYVNLLAVLLMTLGVR
jgi:phosphatidylglycerophosphatase A